MKSLYKILAEQNQRAQKYFQDLDFYKKEIRKTLTGLLPQMRVLIFGSAVKGNYKPGSDIDILIISSKIPQDLFEQARLKIKIKENFPDAPFEIHLATPEQYENWYKRFIQKDYIEV